MAAAILERFSAGTEVWLTEGSGGALDVVMVGSNDLATEAVVYSKKELGISLSDVSEAKICEAITSFMAEPQA